MARAPKLSPADDESPARPEEVRARRFARLRRPSSRPSEQLEEERRLVEAAKLNPADFAKLYDRYVDQIHAFAYHQTGSWERAQDVTATTFMRAYAEIGRFEWRGVPYSAWLYRVAANLVMREHRRPGWITLPDNMVDPGEGPEDAAIRSEQVQRIQAAVRQLSPDQRQAITLRFGTGLRNAEVGRVMRKSEGAVKLLVFRGLRSLERRLGPEFQAPPYLAMGGGEPTEGEE
ncbi:MAG TPA: sigma-70 family RNA polymerase sigma factor [Candidatus Dormibacteraeota bacterium]|nr:sigma-70 family RNA polymerase sigma factor [Candidatus Dormibacteraeota bacterium]